MLLKAVAVKIADIYVPMDRRKEIDPERIQAIAEAILDEAEEDPIQVRRDKNRYVLVKGVNRLEARRQLGEETIQALIVAARQH